MSGETEARPEKQPQVALWIATGFGLGYLPVAPGTWGSLAGIAIGWALASFLFWVASFLAKTWGGFGISLPWGMLLEALFMMPYVAGTVFFSLAGVWASRRAAIHFGKSDPRPVVVDEISGQMITYLPVFSVTFVESGGWKYVVLGFILFRVFDIWKPWPIRRVEKLPGGWGIMADDWLAGVYAAIVLWVIRAAGWIG